MNNLHFKYYRNKKEKDFNGLSRKVLFTEKNESLTELYYRYNGNITAYEKYENNTIIHSIRIGKETTESLSKLLLLKTKYTTKEIQKILGNTRALCNFLINNTAYYKQEDTYYQVLFNPNARTLSITTKSKCNAPDSLVEKNLQIITNLADRLWRDISDIGDIEHTFSVPKNKSQENQKSKVKTVEKKKNMEDLYPYLRNYRYGDKDYVRNEVPGKCNFFEQEYTCELRDGDKIIKYNLDQFVYMFINNFNMYVSLNQKICESLSKLKDLTYYYTTDSLNEVFKSYPYTLQIIKNETSFSLTSVRFTGCGLEKKGMFPTKSYFFDNYESNWARELRNVADSLMKEATNLKIDFDKLRKKEALLKNTEIPKWLIAAAAIGGVVLIKLAVKSIANSDIDIDVPDFDGDTDVTSIDIDTGEICSTNDGYSADGNGYNISFGASQESIQRDLRAANKDIDYYTKQLGRSNITDVYRDNCQFKLDQAIKKAAELAKELDKLIKK